MLVTCSRAKRPIARRDFKMAIQQQPNTFPSATASYLLSFQFSSWYPAFSAISIKSTVIRPLSGAFHKYLDADGVFVPEGSEDLLVGPLSSTRALSMNVSL